MKFRTILVALMLLVAMPSAAAPFHAEEMLTATALVDTDQLSRWVVTAKGTSRLYCEIDLTAISGGGSVKFGLFACKPSNILDDGCTDITDGDVWYLCSAVSPVATDRIAILPFTTTGE